MKNNLTTATALRLAVCFLVLLFSGVLPTSAAQDSAGQALYEVYCTACHGVDGNGKGINVPDMSVQPRDHTDASEMGARTDEELHVEPVVRHYMVGESEWGPGARVLFTAELVAELRVAFKAGPIRSGCEECEWHPRCTQRAEGEFEGARLQPG